MSDDSAIEWVRRIAEQDYTAARAEAADRVKNQMSIADATMKALLLANGGAMIALFTFLGNLLAKSTAKPAFDAGALWAAFSCFVAGLVLALLTHALAFLSQERFYYQAMDEVWRCQNTMVDGVIRDISDAERRANRWGNVAYAIAFVLAVGSIVCFAFGCASALRGVLIR